MSIMNKAKDIAEDFYCSWITAPIEHFLDRRLIAQQILQDYNEGGILWMGQQKKLTKQEALAMADERIRNITLADQIAEAYKGGCQKDWVPVKFLATVRYPVGAGINSFSTGDKTSLPKVLFDHLKQKKTPDGGPVFEEL